MRMAGGGAERGPRLAWAFLMVAIFTLAHLTYRGLGIRFDEAPLGHSYQFVDPDLLRHRLGESLLYLHSQPPLFNLFLGLVLKLFPGHEGSAFCASYLFMGILLYFALFAAMRRLGISRALALVLSTWFMASPSFILYEHWLFYTLPLASALILSALLFYHVLNEGRPWQLLCFFGLLLTLCGVYSAFHLVYYLLLLGGVLMLCPGRRRIIMVTAAVPLILLASLYAKNLCLFGKLTASSWLGMNLSGTTVRALPTRERDQLVADGKLSRLALIPRFSPLAAYPGEYLRVRGFDNITALRQVSKSTGATNYNHLAYIAISEQYLRDAVYVITHRPKALLVGLLNAWLSYFRSSSDYPLLYGNLNKIAFVNCVYDYLFYGKVPRYVLPTDRAPIYFAPHAEPRLYVFLIIGLPVLVWYGLRVGIKGDATSPALTRSQRMLVLYACFNIVYVALVGNLFEVSENHRFRFVTDPLYVMLCGLLIQRWALPRAASALRKSARQSR